MALPKTVALIADRLNATGAMTYGDYRATSDIDIIIVLAPSNVGKMGAAFPLDEFYCPPGDVISIEAARPERGHFNLIHHETGFKADIYVAGADALTRWAFMHRQKIPFDESTLWVAPPEYVIIGKLEFFREGGSEKHLRDIRGMLKATEIDRAFLEKEVALRGLSEVWERCRSAD
jgi:hypothetical protein